MLEIMNASVSQKGKVIYPVELFAVLLNLIFCICSLLNIGKIQTNLFGLSVDRELIMGIIFLQAFVVSTLDTMSRSILYK